MSTSKCEYRRSSETVLHKVESSSSNGVTDEQEGVQLCKSTSGPLQQQGEIATDRSTSPNATRTKNLYRFTLNENLLTMKVTDDADSQDTQSPRDLENVEEEKRPSDDGVSCNGGKTDLEDICTESRDSYAAKGVSATFPYAIHQPYQNNSSNTEPGCYGNGVETPSGRTTSAADHFSLRGRYPHSFNDIPNQSSFQYRLHKHWDLHSLRSSHLRPIGNRSHGDLNLKALLQREDCYLKTLRLNGDLRHRYSYNMSRPFGIWHQSQSSPKEEHLQTLMKLLRIFNSKSDLPAKLNKGTDMFDPELNPVGDSKSEHKPVDTKQDNLKEKESRTSNDSIDPMDIHRLKSACNTMCNQLSEIHNTISYVHGDLKTLLATISPSPSMCLMEEIAELREAYELTATNDRKRDVQMRKIEGQLHDICCKLEKVAVPKKRRLLYTYLLVPVIGCVAFFTFTMLGEGKKEIPIDVVPLASSVVEKVVQ